MADGIVINKLTKQYAGSDTPALNQLSLTVAPGEIYGFLGANGAGKSTTIRLLLNFIQPTGGTASINGNDVVRDNVAVKRHVGYLAGDVALYQKATGAQMLDYLFKLQGGTDTSYRDLLVKRFEATTDQRISELSKGNRQKLGIIQACMCQPQVLILDEPTSGLDPLMQEAFYTTIREARDRGAAVLMSSHNLAEAQNVCDRIGIIKHGKLIHEQTMSDRLALSVTTFRITLSNKTDVQKLQNAKGIKIVSKEGATLVLQPTTTIQAALKTLSGFDIHELSTQQLSLEDEFLEFYEGSES